MIQRLRWRVTPDDAIRFWAERPPREGVVFPERTRDERSHKFPDPGGMSIELAVVETEDSPLVDRADGIGPEYLRQGFDGARASGPPADLEEPMLTEVMGFEMTSPGTCVLGLTRRLRQLRSRRATLGSRRPRGEGTVHHIACCDRDADLEGRRDHLAGSGSDPTAIIDRQYFLSNNFRGAA